MARKRMFDTEIITQDSFLDLPMESKALYFLLGMEADDEGFVNPNKVLRLYGGTQDGIKVLIAKGYLIPFKSGVVVITDWNSNNWLDKRRAKNTIYLKEKNELSIDKNTNKYILAKPTLSECLESIEENSIEENRLDNIYSPVKTELLDTTSVAIKEIVSYLNEVCNKNYKLSSTKTRTLIKARLNEGFTIEDFKKVIDKKSQDKYFIENDYLRPETLFGTKFETYLNQHIKTKEDKIDFLKEVSNTGW